MSNRKATALNKLADAVESGKTAEIVSLVEQGVAVGLSAQEMLYDGLIRGMTNLGVRFKNHQVFVPDVLVAARTLRKGSEALRYLLVDESVEPIGKAVVATVSGDLHDVGKNLVCMMLEGVGFKVVDLGVDVSSGAIVEAIREHKQDIVGLSALLNTTLNQLSVVVEEIRIAGLRDEVIILIGGSPVDEKFAIKIGADAYADNAVSAAETAKKLLKNGGSKSVKPIV